MIILTAKIIFRRFFEILFCEALLSAVIAALSVCNALTNLGTLITVLFVGVLLFMGIHFMLLRTNCYELPDNFLYFVINLTAYLLFAIFALGVYMLCSPDVYTWLFAVYDYGYGITLRKCARPKNYNTKKYSRQRFFHNFFSFL